jgi:hypothetical protein
MPTPRNAKFAKKIPFLPISFAFLGLIVGREQRRKVGQTVDSAPEST